MTLCGAISHYSGWALTRIPNSIYPRYVIVTRTPPNRIPYAAQSDSVRRPIGFRPPSDQIAFAARSDGVRSTMTFAIISHNISVGFISHKWGI